MAVDLSQVTVVDTDPGELPKTMPAWVVRDGQFGEPIGAIRLEEVDVPEPGAFEVVVRVTAAGVNFDNVWAALGEPVSVFKYGDHPECGHHIGGSDASGIVWKVGDGVTRWKPGDEVVVHCNQASYEDPEVHGLNPVLWQAMGFDQVAEAHQLLRDNKHLGKIAVLVGASAEGQGKTADGPGAIRAEVGA